MDKTDSQIRTAPLAPALPVAQPAVSQAPRLVVVLSAVEAEGMLAGQIISVARDRGLKVLLLGLAESPEQEAEFRRKLITLAAFIRDGGSPVEIKIEIRRNWLASLKGMLGAHDLLACCVEDPTLTPRLPLSDTLSLQLERPVYVFSRPHRPVSSRRGLPMRLATWAGSLSILLGFLWLQLGAARSGNDTTSTALLLLSLPVEIGLMWAWNSVIG